jgi:hypothetical protein
MNGEMGNDTCVTGIAHTRPNEIMFVEPGQDFVGRHFFAVRLEWPKADVETKN